MKLLVTWHARPEEIALIRAHVPADVEIVVTPARAYQGRYESDPADVTELVRDADILMGLSAIPREALQSAARLKFIARLLAGCDQLDLPLLRERGIRVSNVTGASDIPVAEHAFALMLALAKRIVDNHRSVVEVRAHSWFEPDFISVELAGKTLVIVGLGRIGERVAKRARAFEMRVLGVKTHPSRHDGHADAVYPPDRLREVLAQADFTILAVPLTPATRHLIGEPELRAMRPTSYLVNVARGELVHEGPLARALREGRIAGFASDVGWDYPDAMPPGYHFAMPSRHDVHRLPSVICSGDAAANTMEVMHRIISRGAESAGAFARGEVPPRLVDLDRGY
jgi:phosphoglycerate dehydrogenase-like enzyme